MFQKWFWLLKIEFGQHFFFAKHWNEIHLINDSFLPIFFVTGVKIRYFNGQKFCRISSEKLWLQNFVRKIQVSLSCSLILRHWLHTYISWEESTPLLYHSETYYRVLNKNGPQKNDYEMIWSFWSKRNCDKIVPYTYRNMYDQILLHYIALKFSN